MFFNCCCCFLQSAGEKWDVWVKELGGCSLNAWGLGTCISCLMSCSPTYVDNPVKALWLNHWHQGLNSYVYFNVLNYTGWQLNYSWFLPAPRGYRLALEIGLGLHGAGIILKALYESTLQQTKGMWGRASSHGGEQWHNLMGCRFLCLLLSNPECDRFASRMALVPFACEQAPSEEEIWPGPLKGLFHRSWGFALSLFRRNESIYKLCLLEISLLFP